MRAGFMMLALVIATVLLRSTLLTGLASQGIIFDLLAFATVVWSLRTGESWGATFGFLLGLAADLDAAHWLGRHALLLSLVGYGVGRLSRTVVGESPRTHAVLLLTGTAMHQAWVAAFDLGGPAGWSFLLQRVVLAAVATVPVGTLILIAARRLSGRALFGHATIEQ